MSKASQRHLARIKLNGPFAAAVNLVAETKLPTRKVTELVKAIQTAPSEAEALNAVGRVRGEVVPSGPPPHRVSVPPELARARMLLPQVVKLAAVLPLTFVESDPDKRAVALEQWCTVRDLATEVVESHGGGDH